VKAVLDERLKLENNNLSATENQIIESLDKFCALLSRVVSFNKARLRKEESDLWHSLYEEYWIRKLYSRPEIEIYVRKYWNYLHTATYEQHLNGMANNSNNPKRTVGKKRPL